MAMPTQTTSGSPLAKHRIRPSPTSLTDGFSSGYPLVTAELTKECEVVLSQQRWLSSRSASASWRVPVQLRVQTGAGGEIRRVLLTGTRLNVSCPPDTQFILVNEGGHGFYRVRYGPNLLKRMLEAGLEKLAPIERLNLVNDAWATTIAGLMPLSAIST